MSASLTSNLTTDPKEAEAILKAEGYKSIYAWSDSAGSSYRWHSHPDSEARWIIEGSITIGTEDGELFLEAGDRLDLPAGTKHYASTKTGVTYICASI